MYAVRRWSVRHARGLQTFYNAFEWVLVTLHPLWKRIGYARLEKPFAAMEKLSKGTYLMKISIGNGPQEVRKLIKQLHPIF